MKFNKNKLSLLASVITLSLLSCAQTESSSNSYESSNDTFITSSNPNISSSNESSNQSSIESSKDSQYSNKATIYFGEKTEVDSIEATNSSYKAEGINISNVTYANCYCQSFSASYAESNALRIGSRKKSGSFTMVFSNSYVISQVDIYASKYDNDNAVAYNLSSSANSTGSSITIADSIMTKYSYTNLDNGKADKSTSITFSSTSLGRIYVYKIDFTILQGLPSSSEQSSVNSTDSNNDSASSSSSHTPSIDTDGYYQGVDWNATGATLKTSLYNIISKNTKVIGYDGLWNAYKTTDVTSDGYIWDMYSNEKYQPGGSKQGANYNSEGDSYNREHTIPQSVFGKKNNPMYSDIFHVVPTDGYVNNKRSNYPHGNVSNASYTSNNGSKLGTGNNNGYTETVFEVIDEYKGDFARMYFYFVTRYQDNIPNYTYASFDKSTYPSLSTWAIKTYMSWNELDPVSEKETNRNEAAYKLQGNRNPFIDHPEAAQNIWGSYL